MNRKELEAKGYTTEQIDELMDLNGKAINKANQERDEAVNKYTEAQTQLTKRDEDIKELQKNVTSQEDKDELARISKEYEEYKNGATEREQKLKLNSALGIAIAKSDTVDEVSLRANLDMDKITLDDEGNLVGVDEQLTTLKESKSFLFGGSLDGGLKLKHPPKQETLQEQVNKSMGIR